MCERENYLFSNLQNPFLTHVFPQRFVVSFGQPIAAGKNDFELPLQVFCRHPTTCMVPDIPAGMS